MKRDPEKSQTFDNIAKLVLDSLNTVAYKDDACIVELIVRKYYTEDEEHMVIKLMEAI